MITGAKAFDLTDRSATQTESTDQRRQARNKAEVPAIMQIEGSRGTFLVTVLDVSKTGFRVSCSTAASPGKRVTVSCGGATVSGEVRYCRDIGGNDFNLGIAAANGSAHLVSESGELDVTLMFKRPAR
jgi:hypothetical protein